jgi:hypothetical protein
MKDVRFNKAIKDIKKISLSKDEKSRIHDALKWYAEVNASIRSPYSVFSWTHRVNKKLSFVVAGLLIMLIASGSTVYASQNALPGDVLYPIKVDVVEPLAVALAINTEARQRVQVSQVEERLKEAEALAVQGRLTASTSDEIKNVVQHDIESLKGKLSKQNQEDLSVRVSAHSDILRSIKDHSDNNEEKHQIENVETAMGGDQPAQVKVVNAVKKSSKPDSNDDAQFNQQKDSVLRLINDTSKKIENSNKEVVSTSSYEYDVLNNASNTIQQAKFNLDKAVSTHNNNDNQSHELMRGSEQDAQKASITVDGVLNLGKFKSKNNDDH